MQVLIETYKGGIPRTLNFAIKPTPDIATRQLEYLKYAMEDVIKKEDIIQQVNRFDARKARY